MAKIIPAILTADPADLQNKINQLAGLTDFIQLDIMDGKFVPDKSVNLDVIDKLSLPSGLSLEIHLMVKDPLSYLKACRRPQIKRIFFHLEALKNPAAVQNILAEIKRLDCQAGLAIKSTTAVEKTKPYLDQLDSVMFLSVNPGKQGQKFITSTFKKIKALRQMSSKIKIAVDGGINRDNIVQLARLGVDYLSIGSAIVKSTDVPLALKQLKQELASHALTESSQN